MELITDRTESDALLKNKKGTYGYTDLNRVEQACEAVMAVAEQLDIRLDLEIKTDWGAPSAFPVNFPTESQMNRYLGNVREIRNAFGISVQLPQTMNRLTWRSANNIEKVLEAAFLIADQTIPNFVFCGELFAGEE